MVDILKFGDALTLNEKDYVFLSVVGEIMFAAQILNLHQTNRILAAQQKADANPARRDKVQDNLVYCFVTLKTSEFKGRMANFADHQQSLPDQRDPQSTVPLGTSLIKQDLKEILAIILDPNSPLPKTLKDSVKDIVLT